MKKLSLLLLPGLLNDERLYQHQVANLADVAQATVADISRKDSMAALAADALAQMPAERFALAGMSMGGYVAFEILRQAPQRVIGLALLNTSARPDTPESTENRRRQMKIAETDLSAIIETMLPKQLHPTHLKNKAIADLVRAMATRLGKDAFMNQQRANIGRADSRPLLGQIKYPTLVLSARDDAIIPVEIHQEMAAGIAGATLTILEECGHLSPISQPQRVTDALRKWLSGVKL